MRRDMAKVIVERPRKGGGKGRKPPWTKNADPDDLPSKEGMKKRHIRGYEKSLNENLRPLERFLNKQVGRPWDKVYSEICDQINTNNAVQKHVRDHVWDFVERHVVMKDKHPYHPKLYNWAPDGRPLHKGDLFIHPETGLLVRVKRNPPEIKRKKK